jgi:hypothetical protein
MDGNQDLGLREIFVEYLFKVFFLAFYSELGRASLCEPKTRLKRQGKNQALLYRLSE